MATNSNKTATNGHLYNGLSALELHLTINDHDLCEELGEHTEGPQRNKFAISAMKIGVIALRQAQGRIDADRVRQAEDHLLTEMGHAFEKHLSDAKREIGGELKDYLDPREGRLKDGMKSKAEIQERANAVYERVEAGESQASIARDMGVTRQFISRIYRREIGYRTGTKVRKPPGRRPGRWTLPLVY